MAPKANYDLFWELFIDHSELKRLEGIFNQLDLGELVDALYANRKISVMWILFV